MKTTRWYFKLRGNIHAYGPVSTDTKEDLKIYIRKWFGIKNRIAPGTQMESIKLEIY